MRKLLGLIVFSVLVAGCGGIGGDSNSSGADETATAAAQATQTQAALLVPAHTFTPEPTAGPSSTPQPSPTTSPTPGPTPSGGAKWIAFSIFERVLGAYESHGIYHMTVDGSELELVVEPGYTLLGVSPSGLRMLVSAGNSLYTMGIDASNQRLLTDNLYDLGSDSAYWTSDEHKIVFIAGDGTNNAVFVGHPDTSEIARISQEDLNPIEVYPSLDASGVFWRAGSCFFEGDCTREALMWSSMDGGAQRAIRDEISRPEAAPTGDRIVYATVDDLGRNRLETSALDGSQAQPVYAFGNHFMDYGWSPGGIHLAVIITDRSDYSGILLGHRYYVVDIAQDAPQELPWTLGANTNLAWSPDGFQIMFSGTEQTDTGFHISMTGYDLLAEQQFDVQDWEAFTSTGYVFIPQIYWIP